MISDQRGALNLLLIPLITSITMFFIALGFGIWAYVDRTHYKNDSDQIVKNAVDVATKKVASEKDNEYLEKEKYPLLKYQSPAQFGSINISYPKTWSAYVDENDNNPSFIFNPRLVPADRESSYALKITIENTSYDQAVDDFDGEIIQGNIKAKAYSLPKVPNVVGLRFDGTSSNGKVQSVILLPLRDKTIKILALSPERFNDFNKIILPNLSFSP